MERRDIEAAKQAGILDTNKAAELEAFLRKREDPGASSDNESLRFLANFNDVFISIGLILLAIGLSIGSGLMFGTTGNAIMIVGPVIVCLWLLLEYFAGRRRLLLPSMVLSVLVTGMAMILVGLVASGLGDINNLEGNFNVLSSGFGQIRNFGVWTSLGALATSGLIFFRFRLPFSLFLMALAAAFGFYTIAATQGELGAVLSGTASFIIGLITLAVAILFDARDPERKGLSSDNAFWLHFAAAPQIMLGLRGMMTGGGFQPSGTGEAIGLLLALASFALLSLALNRRALIAAALLSFWLALSIIVESTGGSELSRLVWTLIVLGGAIVLLGAGWKTARRIVLAFAPKTGIFARIFPPEPA